MLCNGMLRMAVVGSGEDCWREIQKFHQAS